MQLSVNRQKDVWGRGPELVPFCFHVLPIACPISLSTVTVTSRNRTCDLQVIQHLQIYSPAIPQRAYSLFHLTITLHRGTDVFRLSGSRLYDVKPACHIANRFVGGGLQWIRLTSAGQLLADGDVQCGSTFSFRSLPFAFDTSPLTVFRATKGIHCIKSAELGSRIRSVLLMPYSYITVAG